MNILSLLGKAKAIAATVAAVWPLVDALVVQVEHALPAGTPGASKLAQVKAYLDNAWITLQGVETDLETAWPTIAALVQSLVALYNGIGLFARSSSANPPSALGTSLSSTKAAAGISR